MNKIIITLLLVSFSSWMMAQETQKQNFDAYQFSLGVQIGTDIGGAIPFPLSNIPSPFNAYPQVKPSIGVKVGMTLINNWSLGAEVTYKNVGMKADARVKNQKFNNDGNHSYFTGSAKMEMEFVMIEFPVYVKYTFANQKDKILLGPYFAFNLNNTFTSTPQKGFIGGEPDAAVIINTNNFVMNFTDQLASWDCGFLLGYERRILDRVDLGIRFSMGFVDIFKSSSEKYFDYHMLHMRGSFTVSYDLIKQKVTKNESL